MSSKVLVIGDVIVDQYYFGRMKGISYEAPIPMVEVLRTQLNTGASSLVAENLAMLRSKVWLCGIVGNDNLSKWLRIRLNKMKINTNGIISQNSFNALQRTRILIENHHIARFDSKPQKIVEETERKLLNKIKILAEEVNCIVLSDYGMGMVTDKIISKLEDLASHKKVIISPNANHLKYQHPDFVYKIKIDDAQRILGLGTKEESPESICNILNKEVKSNKIILTLGANGLAVYEDGEFKLISPTHNIARDVTSVGEILVAAFANAYSAGATFVRSAAIGNVAAGSVIEKIGNKVITKNELSRALQEYDRFFFEK
jgi:D-beta-D-heptose 7-phosphate kinase/D-beta-D-heptose 1-phosphate adenosyltransferase